MDAVVTSIVANQEQHLSSLQDMQKVRRLLFYFVLSSNVLCDPALYHSLPWAVFGCIFFTSLLRSYANTMLICMSLLLR